MSLLFCCPGIPVFLDSSKEGQTMPKKYFGPVEIDALQLLIVIV